MDKNTASLNLDACDRLAQLLNVVAFVSDSLLQVEQFSAEGRQGAAEVLDVVSDELSAIAGLKRQPRAAMSDAA
jgi:hypothetical protein